MVELSKFETSDYLKDKESQTAYIEYVLENGTTEELLLALSDVAHAKGMTKTAKEAGLTREGLYKALSPLGNPSFDNLKKIMNALGLKLVVKAANHWKMSLRTLY